MTSVGSLDGLESTQDQLVVVAGRPAKPSRANEIELTQSAARLLGIHLGERIPFGLFGLSQSQMSGFGTPSVRPLQVVDARVVGIVEFNSQVVQDDVDRAYGFIVVTPALLREAISVSALTPEPVLYGIQAKGGPTEVSAIASQIVRLVPPRAMYGLHVTSRTVSQVELAIKPESVALGGFGVIAAVVCLILGLLAIARQLRAGEEDREVLRSLGAGPALCATDGLAGVVLTVVTGAAIAFALAVGLSPLAPLGPVRSVYPFPGVSFDWTVLGLGVAILVAGLSAAGVVLVLRDAPHRVGHRRQGFPVASRLVRRAEAAGLPATAVVGTRFALEPGRGRTAVPVRSALLGSVLAIVTVVATLTFASSLSSLVATPSLYGWNWDYALNPSQDVPPAALTLLTHDPDAAAFTGVQYTVVTLDGQQVPVIITVPGVVGPSRTGGLNPAVGPPILSGTGLVAAHDIDMGAATLAALHKQIGDSVTLSIGNVSDGALYVPPTTLRIVGTTTLPAVGFASFVQDHTSMGYGAMFPFAAFPRSFQTVLRDPDKNVNGPALVFVRLRHGVSPAAGRANLQRIAAAATRVLDRDPNTAGNSVGVLGVQRPTQIVNYRAIGSTPVVLAVGLAGGAVAALGLTLNASVRRRRRDLALLKALGFAPRQLAEAVAWQATIAALLGVVLGIPLGIVAGRLLWDAFARTLNAVPYPTVPVVSVVLVGVGALVFANLVAALPGQRAARTPTAAVLRLGVTAGLSRAR